MGVTMNADEKRSARWQILCVSALVLSPFAYVLISGPVFWLALNDYISMRTFKILFVPLRWVQSHCQPINDLVNWYLSLFG